jgi:hypothetical protein
MPATTRAATSKAECDARGEFKRAVLGEVNGANCRYSALTVIELQDLLRRGGLKVGGKKAVLIERLLLASSSSASRGPAPPREDRNRHRAPTKGHHGGDAVIIDLTLDSPPASPAKSVPEAAKSEADAEIADSLGALELQDVGVDAGGALADDGEEIVTHGRGREIKEGMRVGEEEMREDDDAAATVVDERRRANDRVQKQREEEEEEEKLEGEAAAEEEKTRRAECGRRNIKEAREGPWENTVADERGREFEEGMRVGEEEMREVDDATATVVDERRQADERLQKQREEEEENLKRGAAAEEEEGRRVELLEYVRRKKEEAREAAIQEQAKEAERLVAEKRSHEEQTNLIKRTLRATATEKFAHYDVLGITHVSTAAEVKRAYKKLVLKLHPDKMGQNATSESRDAFNAISDAYEVLRDESSRSKYDREQGSIGERGTTPDPPTAVPRDQPSSFWNTIPVDTRITVQDSAYNNCAQGLIQSYDEILDRYYVMLDNPRVLKSFEKLALFQNVLVTLRYATAIGFGTIGADVVLLRSKTCSDGRCYEAIFLHATWNNATTRTTRIVDLQPNQFILPIGTVVRLRYGNRHYGMIVGWTESFDQHSGADVSYYDVRMSSYVVHHIHMMNIEL